MNIKQKVTSIYYYWLDTVDLLLGRREELTPRNEYLLVETLILLGGLEINFCNISQNLASCSHMKGY